MHGLRRVRRNLAGNFCQLAECRFRWLAQGIVSLKTTREKLMNQRFTSQKSLLATVVASALGTALLPGSALASDAEIMKKIDALQAEIAALKKKVDAQPAASAAGSPSGKTVALSGTDGITIYGRLDVTYENSDDGRVTRRALQNMSSRIGFKGERRITDELSGIMQIETGVSPDDSANSGMLASRNSYVGLKSARFGSLIAGKHDMPFKNLEGTASQLWGSAEAMEVIIHGKGSARAVAAMNNLHTRQTNVVQYWSPKFANIGIRLAYSPDEVSGAAGTIDRPTSGGSIEFDNGRWNLGQSGHERRESHRRHEVRRRVVRPGI
jgi:hypothetical protein